MEEISCHQPYPLMIWKYFAEIIDEIEKNSTENEEQKPEQEEREGQKENPNEIRRRTGGKKRQG